MKLIKFTIIALLPMLVSGCFEEINNITPKNLLKAGEIKGASFGEQRLLTVETSKARLAKVHEEYETACESLQCSIIYSYVNNDEKAYLRVIIPNINIDTLTKSATAKIAKTSLVKGKDTESLDLKKRLEIKEAVFNSLINKFDQNAEPLVMEKELVRLQDEIETLKMLITTKDTPIKIIEEPQADSETAEVKEKTEEPTIEPKFVLLDVTFETVEPFVGFNISLIDKAFSKSYAILATSASYAIVFLALILPWLPIAMIIMWLISIVFKHKVKIRTIMQNTRSTTSTHGYDPVISIESKEKKKGFLTGMFAKKEAPETSEDEL